MSKKALSLLSKFATLHLIKDKYESNLQDYDTLWIPVCTRV